MSASKLWILNRTKYKTQQQTDPFEIIRVNLTHNETINDNRIRTESWVGVHSDKVKYLNQYRSLAKTKYVRVNAIK